MPPDKAASADNQQETLQSFYYYTGFCCGEISCSLVRFRNPTSLTGGVRYYPDITISNADDRHLNEINQVIGGGLGIISPIKGGFNLKFRGKRKANRLLAFFDSYPPIVGDLFQSRLALLRYSIAVLQCRTTRKHSRNDRDILEHIRDQFVYIKKTGKPLRTFSQHQQDSMAIGYFLAGVFDAEGSVGLKSRGIGKTKQPFFAVAMKDQRVVELFHSFLGVGHF